MNRLQEILNTMNVPEKRKNDLAWLKRNLSIRNNGHPDFKEAIGLIEEEIENEREN